MSKDGQGTKYHRKIAKNYNRLWRVHERYRQTDDRQTDGQQHKYTANVNVSSRLLKTVQFLLDHPLIHCHVIYCISFKSVKIKAATRHCYHPRSSKLLFKK